MFSIDRNASRGVAALFAIAALSGAALAETLVVRAGGPSARAYPAGKTIGANAPIRLQAGDTLTILDSKGTRTLRGPGSFMAEAASATRTNSSFASLVSTKKRQRSRTGAVRGSDSARPLSLWHIDTRTGGTLCVTAGAPVGLWRLDGSSAVKTTIRADLGGQSATASFAIGESSTNWPAALATTDGASYTLTTPGQAPVKVRFTALSANLEDMTKTAAALYSKGCANQYDNLVATLEAANQNASL